MKRAAQVLRVVRLAMLISSSMLSLCMWEGGLGKSEITAIKADVAAVKMDTTVNVNLGGAAEQGMDTSAGKKGATEYEGTAQHGCLPSRPEVCW